MEEKLCHAWVHGGRFYYSPNTRLREKARLLFICACGYWTGRDEKESALVNGFYLLLKRRRLPSRYNDDLSNFGKN